MENDTHSPVKRWYKKKKWWAIGIILLGIIVWVVFLRGSAKPTYDMITVKKADLIQEVSVTGKIKPAQAVDMQFEAAGRVAAINYKVGDKVNVGATVVSLENQELQAAVISAKADLDKTIRNFNSLSDPSVSSSLRVELENSQSSLEQVTKKAGGDLDLDYSNAFSSIVEAITQANNSLSVLEDIRKTYFEGRDGDDYLKQLRSLANGQIQNVRNVFPAVDQSGTSVTPSLYGQIDSALLNIQDALQTVRTAFAFLQDKIQSNPAIVSSSTDRSRVNTEATSVSSELAAISSAIQAIVDQKIANSKAISDAQAKLATAKAAFPTSEDILQKQSALLTAQAQLRKTVIAAPFNGTVGKIDVERGQTVNATTEIVSLVSSAKYQIEADITEIDISKVRVGNPAVLTLDAYGSQTKFTAKVSVIDTAATIVEGVTTYKTVFDFDGNVDSGIRQNMTANIDIQTAMKKSVISIPQRAIISKNGSKIVRIFHGYNLPLEERGVQTGITGKDGYIEITSGLSEGEQVVTFIN